MRYVGILVTFRVSALTAELDPPREPQCGFYSAQTMTSDWIKTCDSLAADVEKTGHLVILGTTGSLLYFSNWNVWPVLSLSTFVIFNILGILVLTHSSCSLSSFWLAVCIFFYFLALIFIWFDFIICKRVCFVGLAIDMPQCDTDIANAIMYKIHLLYRRSGIWSNNQECSWKGQCDNGDFII